MKHIYPIVALATIFCISLLSKSNVIAQGLCTTGATQVTSTHTSTNANVLHGVKYTTACAGTLKYLTLYNTPFNNSRGAKGSSNNSSITTLQTNVQMGLYTDDNNNPGTLIATSSVGVLGQGYTDLSVPAGINIVPGDYWVMTLLSHYDFENVGNGYTGSNVRYTSVTFGDPLPAYGGNFSSDFPMELSYFMKVTPECRTRFDTTVTHCNKFTFNGKTYTNSGTYNDTTVNAAGCDSIITLHLTITSLSSTTSRTDAGCYSSATGSITLTPTSGVSPFSYRVGTSGPYTAGGSSYTFSNLKAGTYRTYVKDNTGCIGVAGGIVVSQNAKVTATGTSTPLTCSGSANGTITIDNPVGTAPFKYKIGSGGMLSPFTAPQTITGLAAGNYRFFVVDANGCSSASIVVPVTQPAPPAVNYTVVQPSCSTPTGTISLSTTDTAGATYKINPGSSIYKAQSAYPNLAAGTYYGYAKDAAGCVGRSVALVLSPATGCRSSFTKGTKTTIEAGSTALSVSISPNPSSHVFKLTPLTAKAEAVQLKVIDVNGRVVYTAKGSPTQTFSFGEALTVGIYMIEVRQGNEVKTYKVVKTL